MSERKNKEYFEPKLTPELVCQFLLRTEMGLETGGEPEVKNAVAEDMDVSIHTFNDHKRRNTEIWQKGFNLYEIQIRQKLVKHAFERALSILEKESATAAAGLIKSILFSSKKSESIVAGTLSLDVSQFDHINKDQLLELLNTEEEEDTITSFIEV